MDTKDIQTDAIKHTMDMLTICTPAPPTEIDRITKIVNWRYLSADSKSPWAQSADPQRCEHDPERFHYYFAC
jgi:hypothetical protein